MPRRPHEVLGVSKDASPEEIRAAYKQRARACHPDFFPGDRAKAREWLELQEALTELTEEKPEEEALADLLLGDAIRRVGPWSHQTLEALGGRLKERIGAGATSRLGRLASRVASPLIDAAVIGLQNEVTQLLGDKEDGPKKKGSDRR